MTSRRAEATKPASMLEVQGESPADFESILKRAIGDAVAWRRLMRSPDDQDRARKTLKGWKADLKAQRRVNAGYAIAGDMDGREYQRWLARQAQFERYVDMRLREIPEPEKKPKRPSVPPIPPQPETNGMLRKRISEWRTTAAALIAGILALEDGTLTAPELVAILDGRDVEVGSLGTMTLRNAAPYVVGVLDKKED